MIQNVKELNTEEEDFVNQIAIHPFAGRLHLRKDMEGTCVVIGHGL